LRSMTKLACFADRFGMAFSVNDCVLQLVAD
jgi:hypothetical protein